MSAIGNMGFVDMADSTLEGMYTPWFKGYEQVLIRAGGTTSMTGDSIQAFRRLKPEELPTWGDIVRNLPVIKQAQQIAEANTHFIFDVLQRKYKVYDFAMKDMQWLHKHPGATEAERFAAQKGFAKEINSIYGGLHWENLKVGKTALELSRFFLLAPDWTVSNFLTYDYTFRGGEGSKIERDAASRSARLFWARNVAYLIALNQALSIMFSGHHSDNWRLGYLGKDKHGRSIHQNWVFAGAPGDLTNLSKDIMEFGTIGVAIFALSKAAPIWRQVIESGTNRNWMGQVIAPKDMSTLPQLARWLNQIAPGLAAPITVTNIEQIMLGPEFEDKRAQLALSTILAGSRPTFSNPEGMKWSDPKQMLVQNKKRNTKKLSQWEQFLTGHTYETKQDRLKRLLEKNNPKWWELGKQSEAPPAQRTAPPPGVEGY